MAEFKPPLYPAETMDLQTVCVTGAGGFVASNLVVRLLAAGHTVHGTVRDVDMGTEWFNGVPGSNDRLRLFKADLKDGIGPFVEAINGCTVVFHVASPCHARPVYGDAALKELVEPAVKGTEYVLSAVNQVSSVRRVVLTSSTGAVVHSYSNKPRGYKHTEKDWNEVSHSNDLPYNYSKTQAEKKAWEMAKAQNRWDLVVMNPPMILGPPAINRCEGETIKLILNIFEGDYSLMVPWMGFVVVDVRDVAAAHAVAGFLPTANGRNILGLPESVKPLSDLVGVLADLYPKHVGRPWFRAPKWFIMLLTSMMGVGQDTVRAWIGGLTLTDGSKATRELGLMYIPLKETLKDTAEALERVGMLKIKK